MTGGVHRGQNGGSLRHGWHAQSEAMDVVDGPPTRWGSSRARLRNSAGLLNCPVLEKPASAAGLPELARLMLPPRRSIVWHLATPCVKRHPTRWGSSRARLRNSAGLLNCPVLENPPPSAAGLPGLARLMLPARRSIVWHLATPCVKRHPTRWGSSRARLRNSAGLLNCPVLEKPASAAGLPGLARLMLPACRSIAWNVATPCVKTHPTVFPHGTRPTARRASRWPCRSPSGPSC